MRPYYTWAQSQLFSEALYTYLEAMTTSHFVTSSAKDLLLVAIHGLVQLGAPQLARCLIRIVFTDLTNEEYLKILSDARQTSHLMGCVVPF